MNKIDSIFFSRIGVKSLAIFLFVFVSACTDYVQQVNEQKENYLAQQTVNSTTSATDIAGKSSSIDDLQIKNISSANTPVARSSSSSSINIGTMTDSRDGQVYKIVVIGTQTWMAQNLNYKIEDDCKNGNTICNSFCYKDEDSHCAKSGRLYLWNDAIKVCPAGWHLPSESDWDSLFAAVGGQSSAGKALMSAGGWSYGIGTDVYGFSALPAGFRSNGGVFSGEDYNAFFWSSVESSFEYAYFMWLERGKESAFWSTTMKYDWRSVRCVKD